MTNLMKQFFLGKNTNSPRERQAMSAAKRRVTVEALESRRLLAWTGIYSAYNSDFAGGGLNGVTVSDAPEDGAGGSGGIKITLANVPAHAAISVSAALTHDGSGDEDGWTARVEAGGQAVAEAPGAAGYGYGSYFSNLNGTVASSGGPNGSVTLQVSMQGFEGTGWSLTWINASVFTQGETDWTVIDPKQTLAAPTNLGQTTGRSSYGGPGYGGTVSWTRNWFAIDTWVSYASDESGSWGASADIDETLSYSISRDLNVEMGLTLPEGLFLSVSDSISTEVGGTSHFEKHLPANGAEPNSQYKVELFLMKRRIYYTETERLRMPPVREQLGRRQLTLIRATSVASTIG